MNISLTPVLKSVTASSQLDSLFEPNAHITGNGISPTYRASEAPDIAADTTHASIIKKGGSKVAEISELLTKALSKTFVGRIVTILSTVAFVIDTTRTLVDSVRALIYPEESKQPTPTPTPTDVNKNEGPLGCYPSIKKEE